MANEVQIQVNAVTQKAARGFQQVNTQMKETEAQAGRLGQRMGGLNRGFGGLGAQLGVVAAGAFSVTVIFNRIVESMGKVASTTGLTQAVMAGFTQDFRDNLARLQQDFQTVGDQFAFTALDAQKAFVIITRESRRATVGTRDLQAAMGLARITGADLATAAQTIGKALLGDVNPLRQVLGEIGSVDEAFGRLIEGGTSATTAVDQVGRSLNEIFEEVGDSLNELLDMVTPIFEVLTGRRALDLTFFMNPTQSLVTRIIRWLLRHDEENAETEINLRFNLPGIPSVLKRLFDWDTNGLKPIRIDFQEMITSWLTRIWDWVQNGAPIEIDFKVGFLNKWLPRIWNWVLKSPIPILIDFGVKVPGKLQELMDWFDRQFGSGKGSPAGAGAGEPGFRALPASGFEPPGSMGPDFPNQTIFDTGVGAHTPRKVTLAPSFRGASTLARDLMQRFNPAGSSRMINLINQLPNFFTSVGTAVTRGISSRLSPEQNASLARQRLSMTMGDIGTHFTSARDILVKNIQHEQSKAIRFAASDNPNVRSQVPMIEAGLVDLRADLSAVGEAIRIIQGELTRAGESAINIVINGNVDDESRVRDLARQIKELLQEDTRRGIAAG